MDKTAFDLSKLLSSVLSFISGKYEAGEEKPVEPPSNPGKALSYGAAVLSAAKADLGVREDLGKNDGKRIREYFKGLGTTAGKDWCAAAVSTWLHEAGVSPIPGSMGARNIGEQFKQAGMWVPAGRITPADLTPGNIAVWSRGTEGWKGHIGVIESSSGDSFRSIEGNSGANSDAVVINSHSINDGNLLGIGILSGYVPPRQALAEKVEQFCKLAQPSAR